MNLNLWAMLHLIIFGQLSGLRIPINEQKKKATSQQLWPERKAFYASAV
jgi:hypothetical protein